MTSNNYLEGGIYNRRRGVKRIKKKFNQLQKMNGVCYFLYDKGHKDAKDQHDIIKLYVLFMQWQVPPERHVLIACIRIQEDFKSFTTWFTALSQQEDKW